MKIPYPLKRYLNNIGFEYSDIEHKNEVNMLDVAKTIHAKRIASMKDNQDLQSEHYLMALLLNELKLSHMKELMEANRNDLLSYQQNDVLKYVEIIATGCESCNKQNGKIITITEALEKMPLPHKECSYILFKNAAPFCRCCYSPHIS